MKGYPVFRLLLALTVLSIGTPLFCENAEDRLFMADIPQTYGEQEFRERILQRTGGTREPVGLILSGGSARAFAHIGVLRYLEESGIVPDFIVTNSMGSIVGMLYAAGLSPDQIFRTVSATDIGELFRLTFPIRGGILDVSRFTALLHEILGDLRLEELPIPVLLISEDILSGRQIEISQGDFYPLMEAAFALPLYFNPVKYQSHLLIDGGVANLVPLKPAYRFSSRVIASTTFYDNPQVNHRNPITVLNLAIGIAKGREGISQLKEFNPLMIRCDVEQYSFMDFASLKAIEEAGYRSAREMAASLAPLASSGPDGALLLRRQELEERLRDFQNRYRFLGTVSILSPALLATTGIYMEDFPGDPYYLSRSLYLCGGLDFNWKKLETSLKGGVRREETFSGDWNPAAELRAVISPGSRLRADSLFRVSLAPEEDWSRLGDSYWFSRLKFILLARPVLRLDLSAVEELTLDGEFRRLSDLSTLALRGNLGIPPFPPALAWEAGYQMDTGDTREVYGELRGSLPLTSFLALTARGFTRRPLEEGKETHFYRRDGFRTGRGDGILPRVLLGSLQVDFQPREFHPTFGEMFILKDLTLSGYGDTGWFGESFPEIPEWGAGLELNTSFSLIGLKPYALKGWVGWDSRAAAVSGGVFLTNLR